MELLVNVDVEAIEPAVAFYVAAFGLRTGRRFGEHGAELLGGSSAIYLLAKPAGSQPSPRTGQQRHYGRHWTPVHLDFVVDDANRAVQQALAAGGTLEAPLETHPWGRLALMADPFGNGFCFVEFIGGGYDEIADPA